MDIIHPDGWKEAIGYANGVLASGRTLFVAGQIGWNSDCELVSTDLVPQVKQALQNVLSVVFKAGGKPEHVARMTWYVTDKQQYLSHTKDIGVIYRELFAKHYPAMTLVEVSDLLEDGAVVEIEATAMIP